MAAKTRPCSECGGQMTWKNYVHTEEVGTVKVNDPSGFAYVCPDCGASEVSLNALAGYERRAASTVLFDRPNAGGAVYKYARKALGLKQTDLAALMGCDSATLSRWENDASAMPRAEQLALAGLLGGVECGAVDLEAAVATARSSHPPEPPELEVRPLRKAV
jgi:DNA-binding transcriptional regulator YiaG